MIFRLLGVDVDRFKAKYGDDTIMPERISDLIRRKDDEGEYRLPRAKIWLFPTTRPGELLCNCTRVLRPDGRELNTLKWRDFTDAEFEGRRQMREYARFFQEHLVGCERSFVNDTGVQVGVRQTRQMSGVSKLLNTDVVEGRKSSQGIARSPWPIELHSGQKPRVEWLLNDYYEVPFGCFVRECRRRPPGRRPLPVRGARGRGIGAGDRPMFRLRPRVGHAAAIASRTVSQPARSPLSTCEKC